MLLRQIKYFVTVVDTGSFTEAAEECFISQSAISQQILSLEKELGVENTCTATAKNCLAKRKNLKTALLPLLPVRGGRHFKEMYVGKSLPTYDSMIVLTHFKGHAAGGFGGSLKNIAIGCADAKVGKAMQHNADFSIRGAHFMEHMVEAGKAVTDFFGKRIAYINVLNRMSVRCDCAGPDAEEPTIGDIGMVASTDLLAIDQACVDMVYDKPGGDNKDLIERIESREGLRQLSYMKELKMGNPNYELISID